jgi:hypothetical protein
VSCGAIGLPGVDRVVFIAAHQQLHKLCPQFISLSQLISKSTKSSLNSYPHVVHLRQQISLLVVLLCLTFFIFLSFFPLACAPLCIFHFVGCAICSLIGPSQPLSAVTSSCFRFNTCCCPPPPLPPVTSSFARLHALLCVCDTIKAWYFLASRLEVLRLYHDSCAAS